ATRTRPPTALSLHDALPISSDEQALFWDKRAARLHGRSATEGPDRRPNWADSIYPEDRAAAENHFHHCMCSTDPCSEVYRVQLADRKSTRLNSSHVKISYAV